MVVASRSRSPTAPRVPAASCSPPCCAASASAATTCSTSSSTSRSSVTDSPSAPSSPSASEPRVRAVLQRVTSARVEVEGEVVGAIDRPGLLALVGVTHDDGPDQAERMARKIAELRILRDEQSLTDAEAPVLVVSQFTLYADTRKGRRPSWSAAAPGARDRGRGGPLRRDDAGLAHQRRPCHARRRRLNPSGPLAGWRQF